MTHNEWGDLVVIVLALGLIGYGACAVGSAVGVALLFILFFKPGARRSCRPSKSSSTYSWTRQD